MKNIYSILIILGLFLIFGCNEADTANAAKNSSSATTPTISGVVKDYKVFEADSLYSFLYIEFNDGRIVRFRAYSFTPLTFQKDRFNIFSINPKNYELKGVETPKEDFNLPRHDQ